MSYIDYSCKNKPIAYEKRQSFFLFLLCFFSIGLTNEVSFVGIKKFYIAPEASEYYKSIDILLYQRMSFELLPRGIRLAFVEDDQIQDKCIAIVTGSIEIKEDEPVLFFTISGTTQNEEEIKKVPLKDQSIDGIIDILAIKIRHFLEQTASGKLRLTSTPLDCDILLDGIKIGKTPAEFILEQGKYSIQLEKEYLYTYSDSVTILPGSEIELSKTMNFKGHSLKPWIISAAIFSSCTIISQIIESKFHKEYTDLRLENNEIFQQKFDRYKIANAVKIILLIPTATTWTFVGYHFFENRSLKKRIMLAY